MEETLVYYDEIDAPIGILSILSDGEKLIRIEYGSLDVFKKKCMKWLEKYVHSPRFIRDPEKTIHAKEELTQYFRGARKQFSLRFIFHGTTFQKKVWQALFDQTTYGKTNSYKDIARAIGKPNAVRAVGHAIGQNPISIVVPCHRIIGVNGMLVGYNGGLDKKQFLLQHEQKYVLKNISYSG